MMSWSMHEVPLLRARWVRKREVVFKRVWAFMRGGNTKWIELGYCMYDEGAKYI